MQSTGVLLALGAAIDAAAMLPVCGTEGRLRYDPASHVALFSMERPARKNAIGKLLLADMQAAIKVCREGGATADGAPVRPRCLVVESRVPGVFCAGADLKERAALTTDEARHFVDSLRGAFCELEDLQIPTIAAVEGKALGGGLELALAADMRVAGDGASMGFPETGLAIVPGAGGTVRAPRLIGASRALEMILTAQPIAAARACEMGLVNRTVPAGTATESALATALQMARNGPVGVQSAKRSVKEGAGLGTAAAMAKEQECYEVVLATEDRLEGLRSFNEKRAPAYQGK